jgi:ferredoxin
VEKVVIFRNSCIACGACIAYCPYGALEPDEEGKPVLIWDLCRDDFACVIVCPVPRSRGRPRRARRRLRSGTR